MVQEEDPSKIEKVIVNSLTFFFDKFTYICMGLFLITDFYLLVDMTQLHILL